MKNVCKDMASGKLIAQSMPILMSQLKSVYWFLNLLVCGHSQVAHSLANLSGLAVMYNMTVMFIYMYYDWGKYMHFPAFR